MEIDPEAIVEQLISIFTDIPEIYNANDKEVELRDWEHSDLTHVIELSAFGGVQGYKIAKQIQENRRRHREAKDQNFIMRPLYDFIMKNQSVIPQLHKVRMDLMKQIKVNAERQYHPRSDNEMVRRVIENLEVRG